MSARDTRGRRAEALASRMSAVPASCHHACLRKHLENPEKNSHGMASSQAKTVFLIGDNLKLEGRLHMPPVSQPATDE